MLVVLLCFLIPFSSFNEFLFSHFPMCVHVARPLLCWFCFRAGQGGGEDVERNDNINEHDLVDNMGKTLKKSFPESNLASFMDGVNFWEEMCFGTSGGQCEQLQAL